MLEQALSDTLRILGADHSETLVVRHYLARSYKGAGNLDQAIPMFELNLADAMRLLGNDHPYAVIIKNDLDEARQDIS